MLTKEALNQTQPQAKLNYYYFIYGLLLSSVAITHMNISFLFIYTLMNDKKHRAFIKSMKMEKI